MPITFIQREAGETFQVRSTSITSNSKFVHCYGSGTRSKWLNVTVVGVKQELNNGGIHQKRYITAEYILGEDGSSKRFHLIQRNVKFAPMSPPPPKPQSKNKTAQEDNGASTALTAVLDNKTLAMSCTVVSDSVIVSPVRNPPSVAPFPFKIDVPPPLPPPLPL